MKKPAWNRSFSRLNAGLKGFSLVELLIVLGLIGVLSVAAYAGIQRSRERSFDSKIAADLKAIANVMEQIQKDNSGLYPLPEPGTETNVLCFSATAAYEHDCAQAAFRQSVVSEQLISKRYMPQIPTDPRSGAPYAYGVSSDGLSFQVAASVWDSQRQAWVAKTEGFLHPNLALLGLIRSHDGPNFVLDGKGFLPYSPDPLKLSARLLQASAGVKVVDEDGNSVTGEGALAPGHTVQVPKGGRATLYFSEGSVSIVGSDSDVTELKILPSSQMEQKSGQGVLSKIRLKLFSGRVWTKAVRLAEKSEFSIETASAIAGVRGTEFGVEAGAGAAGSDRLYVYSGAVAARQKTEEEAQLSSLELSAEELLAPALLVEADPEALLTVADITSSGDLLPSSTAVPLEGPKSLSKAEREEMVKELAEANPLSNALRPIIMEIDAPERRLAVQDFSALNQDEEAKLMATHLFACPEESFALCDGHQPGGSCDIAEKCVSFVLPEAQDGIHTVQSDEATFSKLYGQKQLFALAFIPPLAPGETLYSGFSQPAFPIEPATELGPEAMQLYQGQGEDIVVAEKPAEKNDELACQVGGGYWFQGACWVLGAPTKSCDEACSTFGSQNNLPGLACNDEPAWNDTQCQICAGLIGEAVEDVACGPSGNAYSPYYDSNLTQCRSALNVEDVSCTEGSPANRNRICKCILQ